MIGDDDFHYDLDEAESQPVSTTASVVTETAPRVVEEKMVSIPETSALVSEPATTPLRLRVARTEYVPAVSARGGRRKRLSERFAERGVASVESAEALPVEPEVVPVVIDGPVEGVVAVPAAPVEAIEEPMASIEKSEAVALLESLEADYRGLVADLQKDTKAQDLAAVFQVTHPGRDGVGRVRMIDLPAGETVAVLLHNSGQDDEFLSIECIGSSVTASGTEETLFEAHVRPDALAAQQKTTHYDGAEGVVTEQLSAVVSHEERAVTQEARDLAERVRLVMKLVKDHDVAIDPELGQIAELPLEVPAVESEHDIVTARSQALYMELDELLDRGNRQSDIVQLDDETVSVERSPLTSDLVTIYRDDPRLGTISSYSFEKSGYFMAQVLDSSSSEIQMHVSAPANDPKGRESILLSQAPADLAAATAVVNRYLEVAHTRS